MKRRRRRNENVDSDWVLSFAREENWWREKEKQTRERERAKEEKVFLDWLLARISRQDARTERGEKRRRKVYIHWSEERPRKIHIQTKDMIWLSFSCASCYSNPLYTYIHIHSFFPPSSSSLSMCAKRRRAYRSSRRRGRKINHHLL